MSKREVHAEKQRYVLYFSGYREPDVHRRSWVPIFWEPGQAHSLILKFLGNLEYTREGTTLRITDSEFSVRCEQLPEVLQAEPATITDEYARTAMRFRLGSWEEDHTKQEVEVVGDDGEVKIEKVKAPKPEKPKKPTKPDNFVTISEWAKKWGIEPSEARAMLRGCDLEKPAYGWAFDPKDEKKIKKICGVK